MTSGATLNPRASGTMNAYLGANPSPTRSFQPVSPPNAAAAARDGQRRRPGYGGGYIGSGPRPMTGGPRQGPRSGGGGRGGGRGGGQGPGDDGRSWYENLVQRMDMPLDAMFESQRVGLENSLATQLQQLRGMFNVGNAQLAEQQLLGGEQIGEAMNTRGIYGSGLMDLENQRLTNDIGEQKLGLLSQFQQGRYGARSDYRGGMQEALLALAQRLQGQRGLPLPGRGPYGMALGRR